MSKIYKNTEDLEIILDTFVANTTADTKQFMVKKPGVDAEETWTAATEGTTQLKALTNLTDRVLDVVGTYYIQTYLEWDGGYKGRGETYKLEVTEDYR